MKQNHLLFLAFTLLTFFMMTRVVRAQSSDAAGSQARTAGAPIKGVIVRGNRGGMTEGNPIPGVVVKGGKPGATLTIAEDIIIKDMPLLTSLGARELVIAKGEYQMDYSTPGEARVIMHLHSENIVHRDLAARSYVANGSDANGESFTYTIEPLYEKGVAKDILMTFMLRPAAH